MSQFFNTKDEPKGDSDQGSSFLQRLRQNVVSKPLPIPLPGSLRLRAQELSQSSVTAFFNSAFGNSSSTSASSNIASESITTEIPQRISVAPAYKIAQFDAILEADNVDLAALRKLSWNGIPSQFRSKVWLLMLGYLPTNKARRLPTILRKRKEYADAVSMYFSASECDRSTQEGEIHRQILVGTACAPSHFYRYLTRT